MAKKRVLVITHIKQLWSKNQSGSSYAINSLINALNKTYEVDVFCTKYVVHKPDRSVNLLKSQSFFSYCKEMGKNLLRKYLMIPVQKRGLILADDNSLAMSEKKQLEKAIKNTCYDVVIFEYLHNHHLLKVVRETNARCVLDTHDLMHLRFQSLNKFNIRIKQGMSEEKELELFSMYDKILAIQEKEFEYIKKNYPEKALLTKRPAHINILPFPDVISKLKLSFLGSSADHNIDAINWFLSTVWSDELSKKFELNIYGAICNKLKCQQDLLAGVKLHGIVDNVEEAYENCHVAINPVRAGSGLKIKNIEAIGYGRPVVTTTEGANGMEMCVNKCIFVADTDLGIKQILWNLWEKKRDIYQISQRSVDFANQYFSENDVFRELILYIGDDD